MFKSAYKNFISLINDKKKRKCLLIVLIGTIFTINWAIFASPKIHITTQIKDVTDKDYNIFIENNDDIPIEKKTRDNCRYL